MKLYYVKFTCYAGGGQPDYTGVFKTEEAARQVFEAAYKRLCESGVEKTEMPIVPFLVNDDFGISVVINLVNFMISNFDSHNGHQEAEANRVAGEEGRTLYGNKQKVGI